VTDVAQNSDVQQTKNSEIKLDHLLLTENHFDLWGVNPLFHVTIKAANNVAPDVSITPSAGRPPHIKDHPQMRWLNELS
jgi:hypothetical protein